MLSRVGPGVAVVNIEQQIETGSLNPLSQRYDIGQVLTYAFALIFGVGLGRVHKKANAHGVHPFCLQEIKHIGDSCAVLIIVDGTMLLIFGQ